MPESEIIVEYKERIAKAGETLDGLALEYYSEEKFMHKIINENPQYCDTVIFKGGEKLYIPIFEEPETKETLPPWRQ